MTRPSRPGSPPRERGPQPLAGDVVQRRVMTLWNWLPAFRVVAETGQIRTAARRLRVSASALSRTIKLLEEQLGSPLFARVDRGMQPTELGAELLAATRSAMRRVDDALEDTQRLRVASAGRLTMAFLAPALARVRRARPRIVTGVVAAPMDAIEPQLLTGAIDVAVVLSGVSHPDLAVTLLGTATSGVYCGLGHPLYDAPRPPLEALLEQAFAGPASVRGQPPIDGWPPELPRRVVLESSILDGALLSCLSGELLAVFPDHVVATLPGGTALRRLPCDVIEPMRIYAIHRRGTGTRRGAAEELVAELRSELRART